MRWPVSYPSTEELHYTVYNPVFDCIAPSLSLYQHQSVIWQGVTLHTYKQISLSLQCGNHTGYILIVGGNGHSNIYLVKGGIPVGSLAFSDGKWVFLCKRAVHTDWIGWKMIRLIYIHEGCFLRLHLTCGLMNFFFVVFKCWYFCLIFLWKSLAIYGWDFLV